MSEKFNKGFDKKQKNFKRMIYIASSIFLGLLLSFIFHALAEVFYLEHAFNNNLEIQSSYFLGVGWCALPIWVQYTFPILGIVGGYFLGIYWWKLVYIEKKHWSFGKSRKK